MAQHGYRAGDQKLYIDTPWQGPGHGPVPKGTLLRRTHSTSRLSYLAHTGRDKGAGGLAGPPLRKLSPPCEPRVPCDQGNRTEGMPTPAGWLPTTTEAEGDPAPPLSSWHHREPVTLLLEPPFCHKPHQTCPRLGPSGGRQAGRLGDPASSGALCWGAGWGMLRSCPTSKWSGDTAWQWGRSM